MTKQEFIQLRDDANEHRMSYDIIKNEEAAEHITRLQKQEMYSILDDICDSLTQYEACAIFDILWRAANRIIEDMEAYEHPE